MKEIQLQTLTKSEYKNLVDNLPFEKRSQNQYNFTKIKC